VAWPPAAATRAKQKKQCVSRIALTPVFSVGLQRQCIDF
jgi:hypothetical protein